MVRALPTALRLTRLARVSLRLFVGIACECLLVNGRMHATSIRFQSIRPFTNKHSQNAKKHIHTRKHIYTHTHTHKQTPIHTNTCTQTHTHTLSHTHLSHTHTHTHTHMHMHTHTHYARTRARTLAHTHTHIDRMQRARRWTGAPVRQTLL